jgi:tRNA threonylcarbamoyl adenosine modification protein YeaZ
MIVLAIDTSTPAVTAGLVELPGAAGAPRLLADRVTVDARAHAELLAPQIRELLSGSARQPDAIVRSAIVRAAVVCDAIVCGAGPGPFTGLRVGMVTAAALADGLGVPVLGVCSLDAIAAAARDATDRAAGATDRAAGTTGGLLVATDARRREVYWAAYWDGTRVDGPHVQRPAELAGLLRSLGITVATGAGAQLYADVLDVPLLDTPYPTAAGLVAVAADALRRGAEPGPLVPLYLRRPDATEPGPRKLVTAHPVDRS